MRLQMKIVAFVVAFAAAPVSAAEPAPAAPGASAPAAPEAAVRSKLVCRKSTDTGTRLKARRICYTAEQWTTVNREARDQLKESRTAGGTGGN